MCGPSWVAHFRRSSFIETQAFVENKVDFKSGAIFAADRAVSLECHDKLTVKPRHEYQNVPERGNPRETFGPQQTTHTPSRLSAVLYN